MTSTNNGRTNNKKTTGSKSEKGSTSKKKSSDVGYSHRIPRQLHASTYMQQP